MVDLIPAYHPKGLKMPFVYFDSRTYQQDPRVANRYRSTTSKGLVYPYRSTAVNTKYNAAKTSTDPAERNRYFRFVNDKSFQVISAGLDDHFGGAIGIVLHVQTVGWRSCRGCKQWR